MIQQGMDTSATPRRLVRLSCEGHRERWRECLPDALLEFDPVREVVDRD